jgi:hypothetical protein
MIDYVIHTDKIVCHVNKMVDKLKRHHFPKDFTVTIEKGWQPMPIRETGYDAQALFGAISLLAGGVDTPPRQVEKDPPAPVVRKYKAGRNDLCPCGSGVKFKRCCRGQTPFPRHGRNPL